MVAVLYTRRVRPVEVVGQYGKRYRFLNSRGSPPEESRTEDAVSDFELRTGRIPLTCCPARTRWGERVVRRRVYSPNRHRRPPTLHSDIVDRNPVVSYYRTPLTTHPDLHVFAPAADDKTAPFSPIDDPRAQSSRISEPRPLGPRPVACPFDSDRTNERRRERRFKVVPTARETRNERRPYRTRSAGQDTVVRRPEKATKIAVDQAPEKPGCLFISRGNSRVGVPYGNRLG